MQLQGKRKQLCMKNKVENNEISNLHRLEKKVGWMR